MSRLWKSNFIMTCVLVGILAFTTAWARRSDPRTTVSQSPSLNAGNRAPASLRSLATPMGAFFLRETGSVAVILEQANSDPYQAYSGFKAYSSANFRLNRHGTPSRLSILSSAHQYLDEPTYNSN